MVKTCKVMLVALLVLQASLCMAGEKKAESRSVETLMTKSGFGKQLEQISPLIQSGIMQVNQKSKTLSPQAVKELNGKIARAYDANVLKQTFQKYVQANLAESDIQSVLDWMASPLGEKIVKMREAASTPAALEERQKMAEKLVGNKARVELAKKLDASVKATETGVAVTVNTQTAFLAAMTSAEPQEKRPSMKDLEKEVKQSEAQIRSAIEQATTLMLLYAYRDLTDEEIKKYMDFAGSASGKKYYAVMSGGVIATVKSAVHTLGTLISQSAGKQPPAATK